ncbi:MAG: DNA repair protein RecN [Sterolibacterium sp.]|nr:DNA repair protein RecN [Sterolibacterium sp.]
MLRRLYIRDFVIVDQLELEFAAGFSALTGETGAGKSILIDALSLALGERAENSASIVRQGAERAEISATFGVAGTHAQVVRDWLGAHDFAVAEATGSEEECLLRRIIDAAGRSRAYVNGAPATLVQLRELGDLLCDIHGQHAHHALLRNETQRELLDAQAGLLPLAREVAEKYRLWQRLREAGRNAERDAGAAQRERESLEWQVKELQALAFDPVQWQDDNQEHRRLSHAAALIEGAAAAMMQLAENDDAVTPQLDHLLARLRDLLEYDADLQEAVDLLGNAQIQLQEAVHALRHYQRKLDLEPQRLAELEARIAAVMAMARKQRIAVEELPGLLTQQQARLEALTLLVDVAALHEKALAAENDYLAAARKLGKGRRKTAALLTQQVTEAMQQLAMSGGRFEIRLQDLTEGMASGLEQVEFLVAANAGQPLRPLAKVASGGELSRIGLAIQVIASQAARTPTLIFDEVDVGIGGRVAEIVGRMLRALGSDRQVLCVTHLPQVAACAHQQWNIAKTTVAGAVLSQVSPLDRAARIEELARMLGGVEITATTRQHAAEMLETAARQ